MYRYEIGKYDVDSSIAFSTVSYKNVKKERVPIEKSWFDRTIDTIVRFLKQNDVNLVYVLIGMLFTFVIIFAFTCCIRTKANKQNVGNKFD